MKKLLALLVAAVVMLPGCGGEKTKPKAKKKTKVTAQVDIPVAEDTMKSFFDEDVNEFALLDEQESVEDLEKAQQELLSETEQAVADVLDDDFFWIDDIDVQEEDSFKKVYFEFDKSQVNEDQEEYIQHNIELAKRLMEEGANCTITIEGNACSSAGSRAYNLAISNNRAEAVAKRFVANGVPRQNIKVVGRGTDKPVLDEEGNPIAGDKDQQQPNRRVEIIVYS